MPGALLVPTVQVARTLRVLVLLVVVHAPLVRTPMALVATLVSIAKLVNTLTQALVNVLIAELASLPKHLACLPVLIVSQASTPVAVLPPAPLAHSDITLVWLVPIPARSVKPENMLILQVAVSAPCVNLVRFVPLLVVVRVRTALLDPTPPKQALPNVHRAPLVPLKAVVDHLDAIIALPVGMPHRVDQFVWGVLPEPIQLQTQILARYVQPEHTVPSLSPPRVSNVQKEKSRILKLQYALTVAWGSTSPQLDSSNASLQIPDSKCLPLVNLSKTSARLGDIQAQRESVHAVAVLLVPMLQWLAALTVYRALLDIIKIKLQKVNVLLALMGRAKATQALPAVKYV